MFARRIARTAPMSGYVAVGVVPWSRVQTNEDWLAFCREAGDPVFHPTSTCHTGVDECAMVDPRLRVNGVAGLRAVDASVMPAVPSGNINAAVIAIAEKASDLIAVDAR
jgi:choline dehydrogenase